VTLLSPLDPAAPSASLAASPRGIDYHLDLLALLYRVSAFVAALAGAAMLPLGTAAALLLASGDAPGLAAAVTTTMFFALALLLLLYAAAAVTTGRGLRRALPRARTTGLLLAVVNLFIPPFGTALGAYACWVLLQQRARDAFGRPRPI
jgi:hypothetical protein